MKRVFARVAAALLTAGVCSAVVPAAPGPDQPMIDGTTLPAKLSEFGLFHKGTSQPLESMIPYTLRTPLFSDYADKQRLYWVPSGKLPTVMSDGSVSFPIGSVIVKSFGWPDHNGGKPVETRLLIHRSEGWVALPYIWDADGKDATLALGGRRIPVSFSAPAGTRHDIRYSVPNRNQCKECHSLNGEILPIGPKIRNMVLPKGFQRHDMTLRPLDTGADAILPQWDDPKSGSVADRARAYLDVNCAHCHNPAGSASNSGLFLRWTDDPRGVNYGIGKRPTAAGRGSGGMDFAIAPGDPAHSFMIYRLESTDPGIAMPEVGRSAVHKEGAALLRQWIAEMPKDAH